MDIITDKETENRMPVKSITHDSFARAGRLAVWGQCALWGAAVIAVAEMVAGASFPERVGAPLLTLQALLLAAYSFLTFFSSMVNYRAGRTKINDVVDNAFGTDIGDGHSENYFDNDEISQGTKRLLYNTAESCFFSYRELRSMAWGVSCKTLVPLAILVAGLVLNRAEVIMAIFRITALLVLIIQAVRYAVTVSVLETLLGRMTDTLKHKAVKANQFNAESINYTIEYETLMSWYGCKIPDSVYHRLNESLTKEWEEKKKSFVIK